MNHEFKNKIKARLYEQLMTEVRQNGPGLIDSVSNQVPPSYPPKPPNPGSDYHPIRNPEGYNPDDPDRDYTDWEKPQYWPSISPVPFRNPLAIPLFNRNPSGILPGRRNPPKQAV